MSGQLVQQTPHEERSSSRVPVLSRSDFPSPRRDTRPGGSKPGRQHSSGPASIPAPGTGPRPAAPRSRAEAPLAPRHGQHAPPALPRDPLPAAAGAPAPSTASGHRRLHAAQGGKPGDTGQGQRARSRSKGRGRRDRWAMPAGEQGTAGREEREGNIRGKSNKNTMESKKARAPQHVQVASC